MNDGTNKPSIGDEPYVKEFETEQDYINYLRANSGHPWLYLETVSKEEI